MPSDDALRAFTRLACACLRRAREHALRRLRCLKREHGLRLLFFARGLAVGGAVTAAGASPGTPRPAGSRNELCMKREGVASAGVPEPAYGTGLHAVASST